MNQPQRSQPDCRSTWSLPRYFFAPTGGRSAASYFRRDPRATPAGASQAGAPAAGFSLPPLQISRLAASDAQPHDHFGYALALHADTLVVGAHGENITPMGSYGAAYVFERNAGGENKWGQTAKLTAEFGQPGDQFGSAVAVNGDTIVVGAIGAESVTGETGAAYVFERDQGSPGA